MESLAKTVESLARTAGQYALEHAANIKVSSKDGDYRNVVTNIDMEISNLLKANIAELYPEDAFYSEEDQANLSPEKRTWVIDPIDGTSNYARDIPYYSSCITVVEKDKVLAAAIYSPRLDECFMVADGQATLNGQEISVSKVTDLSKAYVNFHPGRKEEYREWAGETKVTLLSNTKKSMNLCSSALDLGYVACGRCDILIYGTLSTLEMAGAIEVLRIAGGEVYDYETKVPTTLSREPKRIIATANHKLLQDWMAIAKPR